MTAPAPGVVPTALDPAAFRAELPALVGIYARAMGYPETGVDNRIPLWAEHSRRAGFVAVVAGPAGARTGFAYGYTGRPGQWWHAEVARGLGPDADGTMDDYFELTELHVEPARQGAGLGGGLLTALVAGRTERRILLSTPEGTGRAWRLYRRLGFVDVLRDYLFTGDPRPFAVLGRPLPLSD